MGTTRLDHHDPTLVQFDAVVIGHGDWQGRPSVLLDRSAFYPESGGQLGDRGRLAGIPVADVQIDEAGQVHHLLEGAAPALGSGVTGEIDWPRRRLHMALHTAQHVLSRALIVEANAETVSARLGERGCTVDLSVSALEEGLVAKAERLVNQLVEDDRPVRAYFPDAETLQRLPLRRAPKVERDIRVVEVEGFDVSPCGGTHVLRTGQIGWLRVSGVDRDKGRIRIHFDAGRRAHQSWVEESRVLGRLATRFTAGPLEVERSVDRLGRELEAARSQLRAFTPLVAEAQARALAGGTGVVVACLEGDRELLRAVADVLTRDAARIVVLGAKDGEGHQVLVRRGSGRHDFDCGGFLRQLASATGGKGGGRPDHAEGRLGADPGWLEVARRMLPPTPVSSVG